MAKQIMFSGKAREKMQKWIKILADSIRVTMGPRWRNVIFDKGFWGPVITNDWVTIAKEIELEDKFENMWAQMVKEVATKTNDLAWDGTTTATILADAIITEWMKYLSSGTNPILMKKWIDKACEKAVEFLEKTSIEIDTEAEIAQVATNSAQNEEIWNLISEVIESIWKDWVITVEDWKTMGLTKEVVKWMQFDNWYISPYMITNSAKMEASFENVWILITDQKISSFQGILKLLEEISQSWKKNLVIIADDIDWEALTSIVLSKIRGSFNILWIKAPGFWDRRKEILKDIAVLTWATFISEEVGLKLENATISHIWECGKIISNKDTSVIVDWKWDKNEIEERISQLKTEYDNSNSQFDQEKVAERIGKMTWWVAVIKVWAATEVEAKEKKYRIEDALAATKAAISEWIVAGWWTALLRASVYLQDLKWNNEEENIWIELVKKALEYPFCQIAKNWGFNDKKMKKEVLAKEWNIWFNALSWEVENLVEKWIIDPKKVTRSALQNAISASSMFLTTECAIVNIPKKWWDSMPAMPWMWGMGMPWMM